MSYKKKVLFLVPYPLHRAPSQRFRVELFLPVLQQAGIEYALAPFLDEKTWQVLYFNGSPVQKAWGVVKGFLKRAVTVLFTVPQYDYIFIHREASPIGPPVFEFLISKIFRKKIIYDFDDAIWIPNTSSENKLVGWFKAFWKVKYICRWAYKVVGGNEYLCAFAQKHNQNVILVPTCVDTTRHALSGIKENTGPVTIGWTGSHSTMQYLDAVIPVLKKLNEEFGTKTIVISNKTPEFDIANLEFIKWQETTEVEDLSKIDIGIMPLQTDPWCEGKCGFKLIQYMALGIPAIASPVGVNKQIVEQGGNGYLCATEDEWYNALATLIQDSRLRKTMGQKGRKKIEDVYSIQANAGAFVSLFN